MKPRRFSCLQPALLSAHSAGCEQRPASTAPAVAVAGERAATVASLPLKRGYYVATDTACAEASNATTLLLGREGMGGARDYCRFERIEQVRPQQYRVTQACADLQGELQAQTSVVHWTIAAPTRLVTRSADGWEHRARYCAQVQMPPDWQANDINDMSG